MQIRLVELASYIHFVMQYSNKMHAIVQRWVNDQVMCMVVNSYGRFEFMALPASFLGAVTLKKD